jgi:cation diffusion facilitator family transporter
MTNNSTQPNYPGEFPHQSVEDSRKSAQGVTETGQQQRKLLAARLSVISNIALILFKIIVGVISGSVSIISEAIHSGVDLLASFIALFSVRTSHLPADDAHPFGHGKIENISGTIEALLIFLAALWIIYEAVDKLMNISPLESLAWGVVVMLVSTLLNWGVSIFIFKVGNESDSIALKADAWHHWTDVYTSLGVMVSLALIWLGGIMYPAVYLQWLDPLCAIFVALIITHAAYKLTVTSARDLIDAKLPGEEEHWIIQLIAEYRPSLHGFHRLRTRKAGNFRFVEFHIKVDPDMSVESSHNIAEELTAKIEQHFPKASVIVHTEPCSAVCEKQCLAGCFLSQKERDNMIQLSILNEHL